MLLAAECIWSYWHRKLDTELILRLPTDLGSRLAFLFDILKALNTAEPQACLPASNLLEQPYARTCVWATELGLLFASFSK